MQDCGISSSWAMEILQWQISWNIPSLVWEDIRINSIQFNSKVFIVTQIMYIQETHSVWTFNQYISSLEAVRNIMLCINITVVQSNNTVLQHIHCIIYHDPWYPSVYACFNYCMTTQSCVISSDAREGIFQLIWSMPCLLMPWLLKLPGHQQIVLTV